MYITADLTVNGAFEEQRIFTSRTELDRWVGEEQGHAREGDYEMQIHIIEHNHPLVDDCDCIQYLTDHSPYATHESYEPDQYDIVNDR